MKKIKKGYFDDPKPINSIGLVETGLLGSFIAMVIMVFCWITGKRIE